MSPRAKSNVRRRKVSAASRLRPFWILAVFALVVAGAAGYFLVTSPAFRPHGVRVTGTHVVSPSEVLAKAAIAPDENIWMQNTRAMASRIESIPYVETAVVHRAPDAAVTIDVSERTPFAIVETPAGLALIDGNLRVLESEPAQRAALVTIELHNAVSVQPGAFLKDPALRSLRDDENQLVAAHIAPASLTTDKYGQLVATLRDGVKLLLGDDDDLAKKIPLVDPILTKLRAHGRGLAALDLRAPGTPIAVYKQ